jgi:hypothetical protein
MWFTRDGLEQASAEPLARHRAARYAGFPTVADLCCGIGGDLCALAPGRSALAVDLDPVHLRMARENARVHGAVEVAAAGADVRDLRLPQALAVFVDPARRAGGRRLPAGESDPPLAWCLELAGRVAGVGIKAAPGLPLGLVPAGWEVELLADRRELKEAVLWSPALATTTRRATVFPGPHTLAAAPGPPVPWARPGPAWSRSWAATSTPGSLTRGSPSSPPTSPCAPRSAGSCGSTPPSPGTSSACAGCCASVASAPSRSASAARPWTSPT